VRRAPIYFFDDDRTEMSRNNIVANFAKNINTSANSVITNITNTLANTNTEFTNVINSTSNNKMIYVWVFGIGAAIVVLYLIKRFILDENPLLISSWMAMFRKEQQTGIAGAVAPPLVPPPSQDIGSVHPDSESWCFVGEDLTGRYCVKVPSAGSCDSSRTFQSRQDCEMVTGQHLPASIITKQGAGALPLLSGN
jgi:hypothetical protein